MSFVAKNIMTKTFVSVAPDASIDEALELLLRHHISGMPVVDAEGQLRGVISEFDFLKLLYNPHCPDRVSDFLTGEVIGVNEDDSLPDVAELFLSRAIRRVPVLRDGRVVGIISRHDLIRFVHGARRTVAQQLEARKQAKATEVA